MGAVLFKLFRLYSSLFDFTLYCVSFLFIVVVVVSGQGAALCNAGPVEMCSMKYYGTLIMWQVRRKKAIRN